MSLEAGIGINFQFEKELFDRNREVREILRAYDVNKTFQLNRRQRAYLSALLGQGKAASEREWEENKLGWSQVGGRSQELMGPLQEHIDHLKRVEARFRHLAYRKSPTFTPQQDAQLIVAENIAGKVISLGSRLKWPERGSDRARSIRDTLRLFAASPNQLYARLPGPIPDTQPTIIDRITQVTQMVRTIPEGLKSRGTIATSFQRRQRAA